MKKNIFQWVISICMTLILGFSPEMLGYKGRPYSAAGGVAGRFPFDGKIAWR